MTNIPIVKKKPLNVKNINRGKPFFIKESDFKDDQLDKLLEDNLNMKKELAEWILERQDSHSFSKTKEQMQQVYTKYQANIEAQKKRMGELSE